MNNESLPVTLILASSSKYRRMLLQRLGVSFEYQSPDIDESANINELPHELVARLAMQKAQSVSLQHPHAIVIGSDQIAVFDGQVVGKPGERQAAIEQLCAFSGKTVEFLTSVSVQSRHSGFSERHTDTTEVRFRQMRKNEITRYVDKEQAFNCAGSFKAESLGIVLFDSIRSEDPTALIGLPLIRTSAMLRQAGLKLP